LVVVLLLLLLRWQWLMQPVRLMSTMSPDSTRLRVNNSTLMMMNWAAVVEMYSR
jgi:hypothetical protein